VSEQTTEFNFEVKRRKFDMKRTFVSSTMLLAVLTTVAMPAQAQRRASLGIAAGATVPVGTVGDATSTGYHVLGTIAISGTASSPVGFRIDGMYNDLSGKSDGPDLKVWTVNGNLVFAFPGGTTATPYLIAGGGWYNRKAEGADESSSDLGINAGIGARFALSGFSTFAEVRFHNIFSDPESTRFIPLTFGILF
jgi:hypothetical protein